jgi:regulator of protease activity HflC (stomatin/prohibitin superfamily)
MFWVGGGAGHLDSNHVCAGTKTLAEILSDRESIALTMQAGLDEATDPWGVKVERVEM